MQFQRISLKIPLLRLSLYASGGAQPLIQVTSVPVARFFTSSSSSGRAVSGSSAGYSSSSKCLQQNEESENVRVSVWWNFENCYLPPSANGFKVAQAITATIRSSGIKGPIAITAFGDVSQLSRINREALFATGINVKDVPQGGSADKSLLADLMCWVSLNPPPAHLFLISSDRHLSRILQNLRMNNYNILLASKAYAPGSLCSAATVMWDWCALVNGENVIGRHFNQPPNNSWYGDYRIPLQDPFAAVEQSNSVKTEDSPASNLDSKIHSVPKEVVKQFRTILSLYPEGASIGQLRADLNKTLSRTPLRLDSSSGPSTPVDQRVGEKETDSALSSKLNCNVKLANVAVEARRDDTQGNKQQNMTEIDKNVKHGAQEPRKSTQKPALASRQDTSRAAEHRQNMTEIDKNVKQEAQEPQKSTQKPVLVREQDTSRAAEHRQDMALIDKNVKQDALEPQKSTQEPVLVGEQDVKVMGELMRKNHPPPIVKDDSLEEDGFVKKLKRLWFGSSETETLHLQENKHGSEDSLKGKPVFDKGKVADRNIKSCSREADPVTQLPVSTPVRSAEEAKPSPKEGSDKSKSPGFFYRIVKWFKFWGNDATTAKLGDESRGNRELVTDSSQVNEILTEDSFWKDIESFINSPRGFTVISHSKTRERMARNLQKEGPSCLKPLSELDMLHLVDALISEKKWIEENPSESLPFRVTQVTEKSSGPGHSDTGLRSVFLDPPKSHSPEKGEKHPQNIAHAGVSVATAVDRKPSERSKDELFANCQKLVKKITEEHPGGYNLGLFRRHFLEEFGYHLDIQKLGYYKLQSLIQMIPGARIESGYIVPSNPAPDAPLSGGSRKEDDSNSSFDELGPEKPARKLPKYEPSLSEDSDSDSDSETEASLKEKDKMKKQQQQDVHMGDTDSSLLQILDSWYSSKEGDDKKEKLDDADEPKPANVPGNSRRKQKPTKTYSFVTDSDDNKDKEKLIDGILGSLKKSGKGRLRDEVHQESQ